MDTDGMVSIRRSDLLALHKTARELRAEVKSLHTIIARMDEVTPRADSTCDEPGITLSEAVRRELKGKPARRAAALES